jgi:predicted SnoaL-like aldol condensation-catalyzing enzyme
MTPTQQEQNKKVVERLFEVIYGDGSNMAIIEEIVPEGYIQHNPRAGQGRSGLVSFFQELVPLPEWLDASGTVEVNLIAEGDYVVRQEIRTHGLLLDVFRFEAGVVMEHWDAYRPDPGTQRIPGF